MRLQYGWAFPDADLFMSNEIKPDGGYQAGHLAAALAYVRDWSIAIDGGAHVGTWSRTLSTRFARVIAIEPSEDTFESLQVNLASFGCTNVEARRIALGAKAGHVSMVLDGRGAELKNTGARYTRAGGSIPVETIDSWALPSLGLLKLDVEGSEAMALRGAQETLRRCKPIIIYEEKGFGRRFHDPPGTVDKVLTGWGYRLLQTVKCDRIWGPR